jgi:flagellar protein FliO/FliZ
MEPDGLGQLIKLIAALLFVLGLMGGLAFVLRRLGLSGAMPVSPQKKRLRLIEALPLDGRRRAVLIERDDVQHLVILGVNSETVVETGIKAEEGQTGA